MQTIQGDGFIVTVKKSSRRKTTALKIKDRDVSIHIPARLPLKFAKEFVLQKTAWIQKNLIAQTLKQPQQKQFINGEEFLFLGDKYILQLIQTDSSPAIIKTPLDIEFHGRLNRLSVSGIRTALIHWYKQQAEDYLKSRTAEIAGKINFGPQSITVKTYKSRWGSCGIKGDIQYNWKLLLAPPNIIDYVIIHELCHLKHHNHSAKFWNLVNLYCPTFKTARLWLKNNGHLLEV